MGIYLILDVTSDRV